MAEYLLIKDTTLTGIANALRQGLGEEIGPIKGDELEARALEVVSLIGSGGVEDSHVLLAEQNLPFSASGMTGVTLWESNGSDISLSLIEGETYTVVWNDTEYVCTAQAAVLGTTDGIGIGNFGAVGLGDNTGEPFLLGVAADGTIACYCFVEGDSHKVGIYDLGTVGGSGGGGGEIDGVHYVTFMNDTGTVELYKRPVADGDDCADPVERLLMDEPTKESTVQYNYTHSGWATTAGGSADSSALEAVTEDKVVYAAFTSSLRYYTARFFDGETLMESAEYAYGSVATPPSTVKIGYKFDGWTPSDLTIYCDTDFVGTWTETATWTSTSHLDRQTSNSVLYECTAATMDCSMVAEINQGKLYVYDTTEGQLVYSKTNLKTTGSAICFNNAGELYYTCKDNSSTAKPVFGKIDVQSGNITDYSSLVSDFNSITEIACSPTEDLVVVAGSFATLANYKMRIIRSGEIVATIKMYGDETTVIVSGGGASRIAFTRDGERFALCDNKAVHIYSKNGDLISTTTITTDGYFGQLSYNHDGTKLFVGTNKTPWGAVYDVSDPEQVSLICEFADATDITSSAMFGSFAYNRNEIVAEQYGINFVFDIDSTTPTENLGAPTNSSGNQAKRIFTSNVGNKAILCYSTEFDVWAK